MSKLIRGYYHDAGVDVYLETTVVFAPKTNTCVDLEVSVNLPDDTCCLVVPRSSATMRGLHISTAPIDPDYTGTIHAFVYNASDNYVVFNENEAFCQLLFVPFVKPEECCKINKTLFLGRRGDKGLGSTNGQNNSK